MIFASCSLPLSVLAYGGGGGALPPTTAEYLREQRYIPLVLPRGTPPEVVDRGRKTCDRFTGPKQRTCITSYARAYMRSLQQKDQERSKRALRDRRRSPNAGLICDGVPAKDLLRCLEHVKLLPQESTIAVKEQNKREYERLTSAVRRVRPSRRSLKEETETSCGGTDLLRSVCDRAETTGKRKKEQERLVPRGFVK